MNLRKYLKKKNYLFKLLLTIAGFVCIPLIVTQILMLERSSSSFSKLSEENIYENLVQSIDSFDRKLQEMSTIALKVGMEQTVRKAAKTGASMYSIYEAATRIADYDSDDYTVGVFFLQSSFVLFDQVSITPNSLYNRISGENVQYSERVRDFFESVDRLSVMSTAEYVNKGVIVAARPVSILSTTETEALVFFAMNQSVVEEEFMRRFHDCAGVALLDSNGQFLIKSEVFSVDIRESKDFQEFLENSGKTSLQAQTGERKITIYKYNDTDTGYSCLAAIFEDDMEAQLRQYVSAIRNILVVSIILMFTLLGLTVNVNYRPIKKLINKHGDKAASNELSELELLESAFFSVDQKMLSREKLITNFVIGDLLTGKEVEEKLMESCFRENIGCSGIVIALEGTAINSAQYNEITEELKLNCGCDCYLTTIAYRPQILLVCVLHSESEQKLLQENLEGILQKVTGYSYKICYGQVVDRIKDIRTSYLQILSVSNGGNELLHESGDDVEEAIRCFGEGLYTGDASNMQRLLDVVESRLVSQNGKDSIEKYYCYRLLTVYFSNVKVSKEERERLIEFQNPKQLFVMLRQSVRKLCVKLDENEQVVANKLHKKLLNYVDENFNSQNLCLTSAADYMESSIYVVSRLFKEATGMGFKEYITDKRLAYARELLVSATYNVAEISNMSGFENTVYFSAVFKQRYGLPPTQYRKKYQR